LIFVTVGGQMPFDRLIRAVDEWAESRGRGDEVFAQIADGEHTPRSCEWVRFLSASEFRERVETATAIVAHAGMGSILTALEAGKPILVLPRRGDLRETRNDHQIATAKALSERGQVHIAMDESELPAKLDTLGGLRASDRISPWASDELAMAIRRFIWNDSEQSPGKTPAGKKG
jgi:UDP-N-acetylglucosamine transferase subunit ALG13